MKTRPQLLEEFFRKVAHLTVRHDSIGEHAVVYPSKLGKALAKVDPDWFHTTGKKQ